MPSPFRRPPAAQPAGPPPPTLLTGWGRTAPTAARVARPRSAREVAELLSGPLPRGAIARGFGRSYGDAAQDAGGLVLDCTGLAPNLAIDAERGVVSASAGISLDRLMRDLLPLGWFVPVTPGTRQVSVGGAVAADVHGKNHHADGAFGSALQELSLVLPGGRQVRCSPAVDPELFWATVGGLGLTGVVTAATFGAIRVETAQLRVDTFRLPDLDACLAALADADAGHRYTVAWVDLLATGRATGRSVLTRADHARRDDLPPRQRGHALSFAPRARWQAPPHVPPGLLNRWSIRAFNEAYYHRAPRHRVGELQPIGAFFHPLDAVRDWNRLYGPRGLLQYQLAVPFGAEQTLRDVVETLARARVASFLAVLKRFGPADPAPLSFPIPGWTLALDLPAGRADLAALLRGFDERVAAAGGRVYLAKDAVLAPDLLPVMYPRLGEFTAVRARVDPDGRLASDLGRRLGLCNPPAGPAPARG